MANLSCSRILFWVRILQENKACNNITDSILATILMFLVVLGKTTKKSVSDRYQPTRETSFKLSVGWLPFLYAYVTGLFVQLVFPN